MIDNNEFALNKVYNRVVKFNDLNAKIKQKDIEALKKIRKLQMDQSVKEALEKRQEQIDKALIRKTEVEKEVAKNKMELRKIKIEDYERRRRQRSLMFMRTFRPFKTAKYLVKDDIVVDNNAIVYNKSQKGGGIMEGGEGTKYISGEVYIDGNKLVRVNDGKEEIIAVVQDYELETLKTDNKIGDLNFQKELEYKFKKFEGIISDFFDGISIELIITSDLKNKLTEDMNPDNFLTELDKLIQTIESNLDQAIQNWNSRQAQSGGATGEGEQEEDEEEPDEEDPNIRDVKTLLNNLKLNLFKVYKNRLSDDKVKRLDDKLQVKEEEEKNNVSSKESEINTKEESIKSQLQAIEDIKYKANSDYKNKFYIALILRLLMANEKRTQKDYDEKMIEFIKKDKEIKNAKVDFIYV